LLGEWESIFIGPARKGFPPKELLPDRREGSDIAVPPTGYPGVVKRRDSTPETVIHNAIEKG
jgi:hypothetical protein